MTSSRYTGQEMERWSIIEKVSMFTHAVCRISDEKNRGSAILIALPSAEKMKADRRLSARRQRSVRYADETGDDLGVSRLDRGNFSVRGARSATAAGNKPAEHCVLLTTSQVFPCREATAGAYATFLEQPVAGTAAMLGRTPQPFSVKVRGDCGFVTSLSVKGQEEALAQITETKKKRESTTLRLGAAGARHEEAEMALMNAAGDLHIDDSSDEEEEIGYTITYCEVAPLDEPADLLQQLSFGSSMAASVRSASHVETIAQLKSKRNKKDGAHLIRPLPLPLLLSEVASVAVGDTHLLITHVNGTDDRRYLLKEVAEAEEDYCTYKVEGGAQDEGSGGPVFNAKGDFIGIQHQMGTQSICMYSTSIVRHLFDSGMLGSCRTPISDLPIQSLVLGSTKGGISNKSGGRATEIEGDQLLNVRDVELMRRARMKEVPLPQREASYEEVYTEFYHGFESLMQMLKSFSYSPTLVKTVLQEIVRPEHFSELNRVSADGGVGFILEVVDGYPQDEGLVTSALTALGRICLYEDNLTNFVQVDGVPTVIEIMKEYIHQPVILQWGTYCLVQVTQPETPFRNKTIDVFIQLRGVELAIDIMRKHGGSQNVHMTRWLGVLMSNVITCRERCITLLVHEELPTLLLDQVQDDVNNISVLQGLLRLLRNILWPYRADSPFLVRATAASAAPAGGSSKLPSDVISPSALRGALDRDDPQKWRFVNLFFLRNFLLDNRAKLWSFVERVMAQASQQRYSDAAVNVLHLALDMAHVLLSWSVAPSSESRTALLHACVVMQESYPTDKKLNGKRALFVKELESSSCL